MANKLETSIALTKKSQKVLQSHKRLLLIPFVSTGLTIIIAYFTLSPILQLEEAAWSAQKITDKEYVFYFSLLLIFFAVTKFITSFSNTLITSCILDVLQNKSASIWGGIKNLIKIAHHIMAWAFILATYGIGIRFLESWIDDWKNRPYVLRRFLGMKWQSATQLVFPVLAAQHITPLQAITKSAALLKSNWGEEVSPRLIPGPVFFVLYLIALIPFFTTTYLFNTKEYMYSGVFITISLFIALAITKSTLKLTTLTALYLFAQGDQKITDTYPESLLKNAFFVKK